jgi:hypothetical protein
MPTRKRKSLKLSKIDILLPAVTLGSIALCTLALYADFTARLTPARAAEIGTITFKRRQAERKYMEEVLWEGIEQNTPVYNFDTIRTASDSGAIIHLNDGTEIELDQDTLILVSLTAEGTRLGFERGALFARRDGADGGGALSIDAAGTRVEVENGDFSLQKAKDELLNLNVANGIAKLFAGGEQRTVAGNQTATVSAAGTEVRELAIKPVSPGASQVFAGTGDRLAVPFTWQTETGTTVHLDIARDAGFGAIVAGGHSATGSTAANLDAGTYYWRLRSADGSAVTPARKLTIALDRPVALLSPAAGGKFEYVQRQPLVTFKWRPSEVASSYLVEIFADAAATNRVKALSSRNTSIAVDDLTEGTWYWRVRNVYGFSPDAQQAVSVTASFTIQRTAELSAPELLYPAPDSGISTTARHQAIWFSTGNRAPNTRHFCGKSRLILRSAILSAVNRQRIISSPPGTLPSGTYYWRCAVLPDGSRTPSSAARVLQVKAPGPLNC